MVDRRRNVVSYVRQWTRHSTGRYKNLCSQLSQTPPLGQCSVVSYVCQCMCLYGRLFIKLVFVSCLEKLFLLIR